MEEAGMHMSEWKEPVWKGYTWYDSNCMPFWKRQNYGDSKNINGCKGELFRGDSGEMGRAQRIWGAVACQCRLVSCSKCIALVGMCLCGSRGRMGNLCTFLSIWLWTWNSSKTTQSFLKIYMKLKRRLIYHNKWYIQVFWTQKYKRDGCLRICPFVRRCGLSLPTSPSSRSAPQSPHLHYGDKPTTLPPPYHHTADDAAEGLCKPYNYLRSRRDTPGGIVNYNPFVGQPGGIY